ncbi:unnamed protein product [Parnassius mnemosyne]|uniref:Uncharacterized protein n=1 Tax=Parnassius mnemosyne TaxID=213953 RepID=A0AAV1LDU3_9NEOP
MASKTLFLFCAQIFLFKTISAYCNNPAWVSGFPVEGLGWTTPGYAYETAAPCTSPVSFLGAYDLAASPISYGGGFGILSASPVQPYGVSVISENAIDGILAVGGELPFLGTIGLEGVLLNNGAGAVSYGPVANGLGYAPGWPGSALGCGCGGNAVY